MASFSNYPLPEGALLFVGRRTTDLIVVAEERDRSRKLKGKTTVTGTTFVGRETGRNCVERQFSFSSSSVSFAIA